MNHIAFLWGSARKLTFYETKMATKSPEYSFLLKRHQEGKYVIASAYHVELGSLIQRAWCVDRALHHDERAAVMSASRSSAAWTLNVELGSRGAALTCSRARVAVRAHPIRIQIALRPCLLCALCKALPSSLDNWRYKPAAPAADLAA